MATRFEERDGKPCLIVGTTVITLDAATVRAICGWERHKRNVEDVDLVVSAVIEDGEEEYMGYSVDKISKFYDDIAYRYRKYRDDDEGWRNDVDDAIQYVMDGEQE